MIVRSLNQQIENHMYRGKAILIFGPRQSGKSTLMKSLLTGKDHLYLNGDDVETREALTNTGTTRLKMIAGHHKLIFIDEAQRIPTIGLTIKIFTDQFPDIQVIATGSSSFELLNTMNEPLTGRKYEYMLYPLSFTEMVGHHGLLKEKSLLEHRLVYGYYPGIISSPGEEKTLLRSLTDSYLYKDILMLDNIKKPALLEKLLRALALQLGSEVNYNELGEIIGANKQTVEKYIDLLVKCFVIFVLPALNRNARNELRKGKKIYFYDNGVRNAIINDFKPLSNRSNTGALFENFFITERMKYQHYKDIYCKQYFWRTFQQQEIDLVEDTEDGLSAYELKWGKNQKARFPLTFTENYPGVKTHIINSNNFDEYLLDMK